jgi:hypothetical protein
MFCSDTYSTVRHSTGRRHDLLPIRIACACARVSCMQQAPSDVITVHRTKGPCDGLLNLPAQTVVKGTATMEGMYGRENCRRRLWSKSLSPMERHQRPQAIGSMRSFIPGRLFHDNF